MYLVDSSAWIAFFRDPNAVGWFQPEEIAICLPVYQEVLQGIRDDAAFAQVQTILGSAAFFDNPLPQERFVEAAQLFRRGRRLGKTIRSATDCLVAAVALKYSLTLLHQDRDYTAIAEFSELQQKTVAEN